MNINPPSNFLGSRPVATNLALLTGLLLLSLLTGCGTKGVIQTVDDSADYRSARSLPPLKKPGIEQALPSSYDDADSTPADVVLVEPEPEIAPQRTEPVVAVEPIVDNPANLNSTETVSIAARVVADDNDTSMLEIDASFEQAWEYLANSLQKSDVTIFARNEAAGRFSIGCADIVDDSVTVQKRGGWSIFTREKAEELEYCALQVVEKKGKAFVSVLDRSGAIVSTSSSNRVFERILNN